MNEGSTAWGKVADCFCHDDGSLPGIEINKLSPPGISKIYAMLRARSRLAGSEPCYFWSRVLDDAVLVDSVPNAATLVTEGKAEAFRVCIGGVKAAGVELPILGVFVWPDGIELDYRMGSEWGPAQIAGFFEVLRDCCKLDTGAVVVPAEGEGPPCPERFMEVWQAFYKHART